MYWTGKRLVLNINREQHPLKTVRKTELWNWNNFEILRGEYSLLTWWDGSFTVAKSVKMNLDSPRIFMAKTPCWTILWVQHMIRSNTRPLSSWSLLYKYGSKTAKLVQVNLESFFSLLTRPPTEPTKFFH